MPNVTVKPEAISQIDADSVTIDNPLLRQLVVQQQAAALAWLETRVSEVNISQVSIDEHGRVVVADKAFAKVMAERLNSAKADAKGLVGAASPDVGCGNAGCSNHGC